MKHFLTGSEYSASELKELLALARTLKKERAEQRQRQDLAGQHLALFFDKPSLRTRFSFTLAMRELGGDVVESLSEQRKAERPEDQIRVLSGFCDAVMVRTHADSILETMAKFSKIPVINGLSDDHHPCQILADLLTLLEHFGQLSDLTLCYIGDGNNMLHSFLLLAPQLGVNINYCCPAKRQPKAEIVAAAKARLNTQTGTIQSFVTPQEAVKNVEAVYTDVWTSMGFEGFNSEDDFVGFQVNEALMTEAKPNAVFMHCLPMERGKEVSITLPDAPCSVIFQQSENRLHAQKALLLRLLK